MADKIVGGDGDHHCELHRFADACGGEVDQHIRESDGQNSESRSGGKNSDSE
jgi:hypothetical protein